MTGKHKMRSLRERKKEKKRQKELERKEGMDRIRAILDSKGIK